MQIYQKSGWVQSSSEILAGLLGGINAIVAWLIILGAVFAALLCGLVAMLYVIMVQVQDQSVVLRQILNQQNRQTESLEARNKLLRARPE